MNVEEIRTQIETYQSADKKIFVSSSFQTQSIPLLHILSNISKEIDVLFIQTGYHFPETLSFRDEVVDLLGLNLIEVKSQVPKIQQRDSRGQFFFVSDPDRCCEINKRNRWSLT